MFIHHYTHIENLRKELEENFLKWTKEDLFNFILYKFRPLLDDVREFTSETDIIRKDLEVAFKQLSAAYENMKTGATNEQALIGYGSTAIYHLNKAHTACHKLARFFSKIE